MGFLKGFALICVVCLPPLFQAPGARAQERLLNGHDDDGPRMLRKKAITLTPCEAAIDDTYRKLQKLLDDSGARVLEHLDRGGDREWNQLSIWEDSSRTRTLDTVLYVNHFELLTLLTDKIVPKVLDNPGRFSELREILKKLGIYGKNRAESWRACASFSNQTKLQGPLLLKLAKALLKEKDFDLFFVNAAWKVRRCQGIKSRVEMKGETEDLSTERHEEQKCLAETDNYRGWINTGWKRTQSLSEFQQDGYDQSDVNSLRVGSGQLNVSRAPALGMAGDAAVEDPFGMSPPPADGNRGTTPVAVAAPLGMDGSASLNGGAAPAAAFDANRWSARIAERGGIMAGKLTLDPALPGGNIGTAAPQPMAVDPTAPQGQVSGGGVNTAFLAGRMVSSDALGVGRLTLDPAFLPGSTALGASVAGGQGANQSAAGLGAVAAGGGNLTLQPVSLGSAAAALLASGGQDSNSPPAPQPVAAAPLQPAAPQPVAAAPLQPAAPQPIAAAPLQPAAPQPVVAAPIQPAAPQPVAAAPLQPTALQAGNPPPNPQAPPPAVGRQQPIALQPAYQQPTVQQQPVDQPIAQQPPAQQPVAQQPDSPQPPATQPPPQQPVAQQPAAPAARHPLLAAIVGPDGSTRLVEYSSKAVEGPNAPAMLLIGGPGVGPRGRGDSGASFAAPAELGAGFTHPTPAGARQDPTYDLNPSADLMRTSSGLMGVIRYFADVYL
jgi:hypothetical protein